MKTFKEFLEEAYLVEMRKEDKVKGEKKTPLYNEVKGGRVAPQPEGSDTKWKVVKHDKKGLSPRASTGRLKQGMKNPDAPGIQMHGGVRHVHGGGGSGAKAPGRLRGVGKIEKQKMEKTPEGERIRPYEEGPSPAARIAKRKALRARSNNW